MDIIVKDMTLDLIGNLIGTVLCAGLGTLAKKHNKISPLWVILTCLVQVGKV